MLDKPVSQIALDDLKALLGSAQESKRLEFKQELTPGLKGEIALLAGVSGLANTAGGDFILGIAAKKGVANTIPGIAIANLDHELQRLSNFLGDCLEPRLPQLDIHPVECEPGRYVLIFRVPFSWSRPHRVKKDNKFYGRSAATTYPLEVSELRAAFTLGEGIAERIRAFRADRLGQLMAGQSPVPLAGNSAVVLHMIPLPAIANRTLLDLFPHVAKGTHFPLPPDSDGQEKQPAANLDGMVSSFGDPAAASGYVQLFRNGALEGVRVLNRDAQGPQLPDVWFGNTVIAAAKQYRGVINDMNVGFPIYAMLSLVGVEGCRMVYRLYGTDYATQPLRGSIIAYPEVVIDDLNTDIPATFRTILNIAWNSFGLGKCTMYDGQDKWMGVA
jgi:hypothetical protein